MADRYPFFALGAGDVVGDGSVELQWKTEFRDPLRPLGHSIPTWVAIGNHEKNSPFWYSHVSYPPSLPSDPGSESFYYFTYGNVFVLVIDTNKIFYDIEIDPENPTTTEASRWLRAALASDEAKAATWRIAMGHENAFSESWSPGDCGYEGTTTVRKWLWPKLVENKFHAYLSGHTHAYERGMKDGVVQMILGGAGGGLDEWCKDFPETKVVRYVHHYLYFEAGCDTLKISAFTQENATTPFDTITLAQDRWGEIVSEETQPE